MPNPGQQQFRYAQTPSKVLHFRNLPWECTEEELVDLCRPFGSIVNTKCNVGPNSNQAFVEFVDLNQAISMASYFASSSEPAKIRGKSVYIQYSNRHEIVNHKSPGDVPGNVLLVTMGGVEPNDISIEIIHLVFSAFGFVHKIATFEKAAGFQALIQYTDAETACKAKESLDGRSIPRYLLPQRVQECLLRISYSAHTDLIIKFQSIRSRDYTNAYLPVNQSIMQGLVQPAVGINGGNMGPHSNVLLAAIENMQYAVTVDVLRTVFSSFGTVQKIAIFEKNGGTQALVQYPDVATATVAKDALQGHCIYDGGYCKLHLTYSHHTDLNVKDSDKSRDFTVPSSGMPVAQHAPVLPGLGTTWQNPHAAPVHPGIGFTNGEGMQAQTPFPNAYSWDPTMQAGRSTFISGAPVAPGQPYVTAPPGAYTTTPSPTASSSSHANPSVQNFYPVGVTQQIHQASIVPGVVSPPGQPPW